MMFHHSRWRSSLLALTFALMFALSCLALATIAAQAHHDPSHDPPPGLENSDGDDVKDVQDTCPLEPGPASNDGCPASSPDSDGDGVGDSEDNCPSVYNNQQADFDRDGSGDACDADDDNDGTPDSSDPCPKDAADSCVTPPPPPTSGLSSEFFGQHMITRTNPWPTHPVGALGKGTIINWPYIETSRDSYNWSNLDAWVALAESKGVKMFYSNNYTPQWAVADTSTCRDLYGYRVCSSNPNMADWEDFIRDLATRYGDRLVYELWNEPHMSHGWTGTVAQMVALTNREAAIIREVAPNATIVSPSGSGSYMDAYYTAGGTKATDAVSLHAYPDTGHPEGPLPEGFTEGRYLLKPSMDTWAEHGLLGKPRWDTEGSWNNVTLSDADKAAFVARWYILHAANGFSRTYWYAYDNQSWGTLWTASSGPNAGATAFAGVRQWLLGAKVAKPVYSGTDPYNARYTVDMTLANGSPGRAVWHTDYSTTYQVPSQFGHYRDLNGNTYAVNGGTVPIGKKPILLVP